MTRVKICGITTPTDRDAAVDAGAHALGFTVDIRVDSPREITRDTAADLIDDVPPFVTTVLVTMPTTPTDAIALAIDLAPDALQLHGSFSRDDLDAITTACPTDLILAADPADPDTARLYADYADALLVDTPREQGGGGTGQTHDWTATRDLATALSVPIILAGGLTPGNVADAVRTVQPYGVDVASGVERSGGRKDHAAMRAFVTNATHATEVPHQ